jgi:hypothetical protein
MIGSIFKMATFIKSIATRNERNGLCSQKRHPLHARNLPPVVSVEATGVCIPVGNQEILIGAVYKSPRRHWNDADITELLSFRHKCILAGDLNAKQPSWNSAVSNPSGQKLLQLFDTSDFEISAPHCPINYPPVRNRDVLDIVVHYKAQTRPVVREGVPQRQDNKFQIQTLEKEAISGQTST